MTYDAFKFAEKEGWNARADAYDDVTGRVTTVAIPSLLALAETAPGKRILDLCCGTGRGAGAAQALGAEAEGIDISPAMVEAARTRFPASRFDVGDAEAIPREDRTFDAALCSFGVMHVGHPQAMFAECARVLKPGGRLSLSHWVGPPASPLFKIVFGTMQSLADLDAAPPSPSPFALSSDEAMQAALETAGFHDIAISHLPLVFRAPSGRFAEHFRQFAVRAAVILDAQADEVVQEIYAAWDEHLAPFETNTGYVVPMPALAVTAVRAG